MIEPLADHLPWPNLRGKRCLLISPRDGVSESELTRRGAEEVVAIDIATLADRVDGLGAEAVGEFDIAVSHGLLDHLREPVRVLMAVAQVTRGMLVSCEPIDLWLSIVARGRPLISPTGIGSDLRYRVNGAGQKQLLVAAGFAVERTGKPFVVPIDGTEPVNAGAGSSLRQVALRALTGSFDDGSLHRGLLARRVR